MLDHSGRHPQRTLALAIQHVLPALDKPNQATLEALAAENDAQAMRLAKTVGGEEFSCDKKFLSKLLLVLTKLFPFSRILQKVSIFYKDFDFFWCFVPKLGNNV